MKTLFTSLFLSVMSVLPGMSQDSPSAYVTQPNCIALYSVSPDGHYAAGEYYGRVQVYDVQEDVVYEFYDETKISVQGKDVSNNGIVAGQYGDEINVYPALWHFGDKDWTLLPVPSDFKIGIGCAIGISSDGNLVAGYGSKGDSNYYPLIWTKNSNGEYEVTALPYPEKDIFGMVPQMSIAQGISDDGYTVYGRFSDYTGMIYLGIVWKKSNDGSWTYHMLGEDYVIIGAEEDNPGPQPQFEDFVTAEPGSDEYIEQDNEFNLAMLDWWGLAQEYARFAYSLDERIETNMNYMSTDGKFVFMNMPDGTSRIYDTNDDAWGYETVTGNMTSMTDDGTFMFVDGIIPAGSTVKSELGDWLEANYEVTKDESFGGSYGLAPVISASGNVIVSWITPDLVITNGIVVTLGDDGTTGINNGMVDTGVKMRGTVLYVGEGTSCVRVFDTSGRSLICRKVSGNIDLRDVCHGLVVVCVDKAGSNTTLKVVLP